jgi:hypothetical protein
VQYRTVTSQLLSMYHIYNAPRPWVFNQWYLPEGARPVDMPGTITLLGFLALAGLTLMLVGARPPRSNYQRFDKLLIGLHQRASHNPITGAALPFNRNGDVCARAGKAVLETLGLVPQGPTRSKAR